jgi:hypothetical protein
MSNRERARKLRELCEVDDLAKNAADGLWQDFRQLRGRVFDCQWPDVDKLHVIDALYLALCGQLLMALDFCQVNVPPQLRISS